MAGYQVLARKYRPMTFGAVLGQEAIARTLRNAIAAGRVAHAYMFCGPRGVGKTSMARILARALNCLASPAPTPDPCGECDLCRRAASGDDLDVLEIDAASNRKVDDARSLIANVSFHPSRARFKVYIVDEVHMLTSEAFNALLKTLEEPPAHVKFVFATTDPQKVPATILSRCQRFDFRPVPPAAIAKALRDICDRESMRADDAALHAIARACQGGMRDAESLLEQLSTLGAGEVRLDDLDALLGTVPAERMLRLFDAVADGDVRTVLALAAEVLDQGTDPGELLRQSMRHAHDLLLVQAQGPRAADVVADAGARQALAEQARRFSEAALVYAVTMLGEALKNVRLLGEGRLFAETALARLAGHRDMRWLDQLVRDLSSMERRLRTPAGAAPVPGGAAPLPVGAAATPTALAAPAPTPAPAFEGQASEGPRSEPPPEPAAPETPGDLRARWPEVLDALRGNSRLRAALQPAAVEEVGGGRIVLSFPPDAAFHRGTVESAHFRAALEQAIARLAGEPLRVETRERAAPRGTPATGVAETLAPEAAAANGGAPPDRLSAAEIDAAHEAPLTKLVERELGARIVHLERED